MSPSSLLATRTSSKASTPSFPQVIVSSVEQVMIRIQLELQRLWEQLCNRSQVRGEHCQIQLRSELVMHTILSEEETGSSSLSIQLRAPKQSSALNPEVVPRRIILLRDKTRHSSHNKQQLRRISRNSEAFLSYRMLSPPLRVILYLEMP